MWRHASCQLSILSCDLVWQGIFKRSDLCIIMVVPLYPVHSLRWWWSGDCRLKVHQRFVVSWLESRPSCSWHVVVLTVSTLVFSNLSYHPAHVRDQGWRLGTVLMEFIQEMPISCPAPPHVPQWGWGAFPPQESEFHFVRSFRSIQCPSAESS